MCCECGCRPQNRHHSLNDQSFMGSPLLISVKEEAKRWKYSETLEDRLNKVNTRIEALKRGNIARVSIF